LEEETLDDESIKLEFTPEQVAALLMEFKQYFAGLQEKWTQVLLT
jgi:hypothetical protein